jgi:dTDP-4-amino-4,6-dideoxygalactose transaminase
MPKWPVYDDQQIEDVVAVLRSGEVNAWTGPHVKAFEDEYAAYLGNRYAIAVANGTIALDVALHALGLLPGDEVVVTPRSFVASAACVVFMGGTPIFAEIDRDSQNITAATIAAQITPRTKGVIVVHLAGWPCDMPAIMQMAKEHGLWVIEDCAQAHGAEIDGQPVGTFGDIGAYSFCQDKIITTGGEGGLISMNDPELWARAWARKDHGKSYDTVFRKQHAPGFRWLHETIGTNGRMMSIQAVLGSRQLKLLPQWREIRTRNAKAIQNAIADVSAFRTPIPASTVRHAYYRFYTFVRAEYLQPGWSRDRIVAEVNAAGVPCFSGSCSEMYLEKCFADNGLAPQERFGVARELGETSIALLVDPTINLDTARRNGGVLRDIGLKATMPARATLEHASGK